MEKPLELGNSGTLIARLDCKYGHSLLTTTTECDRNCMQHVPKSWLLDEIVNIHSSKVGCI